MMNILEKLLVIDNLNLLDSYNKCTNKFKV